MLTLDHVDGAALMSPWVQDSQAEVRAFTETSSEQSVLTSTHLYLVPRVAQAGKSLNASAAEELRAELDALLDRPADAPELATLLLHDPTEVMVVTKTIAAEDGNSKRVLRLLVNVLAAQELPPLPAPKGQAPRPNPWLSSLTGAFFTPDIVEAAELIHRDLQASLQRIQKPEKATTPDGRPMPRKRDLDATGNAVPRGRTDARVSLATTTTELKPLVARYPDFVIRLGDHHMLSNSPVNAYEAYSRGMLMDFDAWRKFEKTSYESFLESATFMVLSAHKTERVLSLYSQMPLKETDLQKRILEQIERRTQIYARARVELSNNAAISQALVDLLQTLIEDPSIDEVMNAKDKRRFLILIGDAAVAKRQYVEAVGVYTSLGDRQRLSDVGKQLSARIYYERETGPLINRDIELAIEALREANDVTAMKELLTRCRQTEALFAQQAKKPTGYQFLSEYIRRLEDAVDSDNRTVRTLESGKPKTRTEEKLETADISVERLPGLIRSLRQKVDTAVPGQDLAAEKAQLMVLGEQAARAGQIALALEAFQPQGPDGRKRLVELGRTLASENKHEAAFEAFKLGGKEAHPELIQLAQKITAQGVASRGVFNAEIPIAVEAYLLTDSSDRLEVLLNEMLKLRVQFNNMDIQSEQLGRPTTPRNRELLESSIARIAEEYDLVGVLAKPGAASSSGTGQGTPVASKTPPGKTETGPSAVKATPPKPEPLKPEPLKPEPVKATPVKVEPPKQEPLAKIEPPKQEPLKPEPLKPEPVKATPVKVEPPKQEPLAKIEPPKPEPVKPEPVKATPVKVEPPKQEPLAKIEPPKQEPVKPEPVKPEPVKPEPVKATPVKVEPPRQEPLAKIEPPKQEPVKPEPVKTTPVKVEPPKQEPLAKIEPPKQEPVKPEPVKPEPVKTTPVKVEPPKQEPLAKIEPPKQEPVKPEPKKVEPGKSAPGKQEPGKIPTAKVGVPVPTTSDNVPAAGNVALPVPPPVPPPPAPAPSSVYRTVLEPE
ncbi:MAG: hypothetical protein ACKO6N_29460 [Myxococcota bacterium]